MNILGPLNRVLHSVRSMTIRGRGRAVILLYHRVTDLASDPQWLSVPPRLFADHLEILRRHYQPQSLDQLCHGLTRESSPARPWS